jgi:hypothetical protein
MMAKDNRQTSTKAILVLQGAARSAPMNVASTRP